ncbi:MAG: hypothetical protein ACI9YH_004250 [Colwellia sp.]|jgi:hypothetical protein
MHLNLLTLLPLELRSNIDNQYAAIIQTKTKERFVLFPKFKPMIYHFSDDDSVRQSATQYIAHHQCVIANILLGISLSPTSTAKGTITCDKAAERYLCSGISTLYKYHKILDFTWLTEKHKRLCFI